MDSHCKHINLIGTSMIGPKGQVVIPVEARNKMEVKPGDKLVALYMEGHKTVAFMPETELQAIINRMGSHLRDLETTLDNKNV